MKATLLSRLVLLASCAVALAPAWAQDAAPTSQETIKETIEVTATRVEEDPGPVPVAITVLTADDLAARGVSDLTSALALVGGVSAVPGGDGGPAGSVPEFWGLKEFDAFLLVVDGIPWGGAFNPALTSLDLNGVERIEVLRGAAPVLYGATSFVGVIHVIHRKAGAPGTTVRAFGGSFGSGGVGVATGLGASGRWQQSINASAERQGFKDDRTGYDRGQVLYRGGMDTDGGHFGLDVSASVVNQDPASPHPRQGKVLSAAVPLGANHNPKDAKLDERRFQVAGNYSHDLAGGTWATSLAITHSERDTIRGFLTDVANSDPNAIGFEQDLKVDDIYFETHFATQLAQDLHLVAGFDHLYGKGKFDAETFDYAVNLDASGAPSSKALDRLEGIEAEDERNFSGLFLQTEWTPVPRLRFDLGLRLNRTTEDREGMAEPLAGEEEPGAEEEGGRESRDTTKVSGSFGVSYLAWGDDASSVWLFADYRDTFKPAAIDFGPEAEADILKPETAKSVEAGLKGTHQNGHLTWQIAAFQMDFENLVVSQIVNGLPGLANAGTERFKGVDFEADWQFLPAWTWELAASHHDARFKRNTQLFDGVPFVLDGKYLEMSAKKQYATGLRYAPERGFGGGVEYSYVGERFLTKRNTAKAPAFDTWSATLSYAFAHGVLRLDGSNLNDARDPVAESELGDAQYYRLPARAYRLSWVWRR